MMAQPDRCAYLPTCSKQPLYASRRSAQSPPSVDNLVSHTVPQGMLHLAHTCQSAQASASPSDCWRQGTSAAGICELVHHTYAALAVVVPMLIHQPRPCLAHAES